MSDGSKYLLNIGQNVINALGLASFIGNQKIARKEDIRWLRYTFSYE